MYSNFNNEVLFHRFEFKIKIQNSQLLTHFEIS
jgi:hypothetical protein